MKGIMVPLLMIFLTGTVFFQQPQRTLAQNGTVNRNPAQPRSVMDNSAATPQGNPASVNQLGPLELVLNDQLIRDFRTKGQLSAPIKPQQFVNEILLLHENAASSQNVTKSIQPIAKQGEVLRFELTDFDLESIKRQGFRYTFDQFERGRYSQVQFDYRATTGQSSGIGSGVSRQFGNQLGQSAYLPTPSPDYSRPYDPSFMGPTRTTSVAQNEYDNSSSNVNTWGRETNSENQFSNQFGNPQPGFQSTRRNQLAGSTIGNNTFDGPTSTYQPRRRSGDSFSQSSNQFGGQGVGSATSSSTGMMTAAERLRQQIEQEKAEALQQKLELERLELAEIRKNNLLKEQAIRNQQLQRQNLQRENLLDRPTGNSFGKIDPNDAYNQFSPQNKSDRFASLTGSDYADRVVDGYNSPPERTRNQTTANEGVRSYAGSIPGPQTAGNPPDRLADNRLNQRNLAANVNKQDAPEAGILYFMLLFSLGLNVYLGWIARGFYVRYNELADELRETFTATM